MSGRSVQEVNMFGMMVCIKLFLTGNFQNGIEGLEFSDSQQIADRNVSLKWAVRSRIQFCLSLYKNPKVVSICWWNFLELSDSNFADRLSVCLRWYGICQGGWILWWLQRRKMGSHWSWRLQCCKAELCGWPLVLWSRSLNDALCHSSVSQTHAKYWITSICQV